MSLKIGRFYMLCIKAAAGKGHESSGRNRRPHSVLYDDQEAFNYMVNEEIDMVTDGEANI
jgi:hypothetical protein